MGLQPADPGTLSGGGTASRYHPRALLHNTDCWSIVLSFPAFCISEVAKGIGGIPTPQLSLSQVTRPFQPLLYPSQPRQQPLLQ